MLLLSVPLNECTEGCLCSLLWMDTRAISLLQQHNKLAMYLLVQVFVFLVFFAQQTLRNETDES